MTEFAGKRVLVIGGSRGIGAAVVRRFSDDGAHVAFTYSGNVEAADALAAATGASAIRSDAANREALLATVRSAGPIDVFVYNAGVMVGGDPLQLDPDKVDRMIDINARGPYHASVEVARLMPDGGRIILLGSNIADRVPFPGGAAYALTKTALHGLVRGLARDFGPRGITVNVVQPGPTDTDANPASGPTAETARSFMAIKNFGKTTDISDLIAFLAGTAASRITGSTHTVDGGFTA